MTDPIGLIRIMVALTCWIIAIMAILSCVPNGLDGYYLSAAFVAWLLAFWIWPRERQQRRAQRRQQQDWSGAFDALDLIFALIEWPLRLLLWIVRHLDDVVKGVN